MLFTKLNHDKAKTTKLKTNFTFIKSQRYKSPLLCGIVLLVFFLGIFQKGYAQQTIIVPNTFTPNGDGINDELKINLNGNTAVSYNISIFTRWGILMFNTNNVNISWDGRTTSGLKATEGTYFYVLDFNGKQYKGTITLLE